jgi:hypothetical protein
LDASGGEVLRSWTQVHGARAEAKAPFAPPRVGSAGAWPAVPWPAGDHRRDPSGALAQAHWRQAGAVQDFVSLDAPVGVQLAPERDDAGPHLLDLGEGTALNGAWARFRSEAEIWRAGQARVSVELARALDSPAWPCAWEPPVEQDGAAVPVATLPLRALRRLAEELGMERTVHLGERTIAYELLPLSTFAEARDALTRAADDLLETGAFGAVIRRCWRDDRSC